MKSHTKSKPLTEEQIRAAEAKRQKELERDELRAARMRKLSERAYDGPVFVSKVDMKDFGITSGYDIGCPSPVEYNYLEKYDLCRVGMPTTDGKGWDGIVVMRISRLREKMRLALLGDDNDANVTVLDQNP